MEPKKEESDEQPAEPVQKLSRVTERFLLQLDALLETASRITPILVLNERQAYLEEEKFSKSFEALPDDLDIDKWFIEFRKLEALTNSHIKATEARRMLPSSFLVSMVGLYDAYFANVVRQLFILRPEKIRSGEKTVSIQQIVKHTSIDDILTEVVNDELDEVLRGSHLDQLEWVAKKFDFKIDFDLPLVQRFTELTERRNICVHADSRVSKQYIEKCRKLPPEILADNNLGEWVPINSQYLRSARDTLFEVGCRVLQGAWRKARPDQEEEQTEMLIDTGFSLLVLEDYQLAKNIYSFASEIRHLSEIDKRIIAINKAIAMKFTGEGALAVKILDSIDWSASQTRFRLAVAILKDEYGNLNNLMIGVPPEGVGSISKADYREWPLFREARSVAEFRNAFEQKFGEPLITKSEAIESGIRQAEDEAPPDIQADSPPDSESDEPRTD
jgi:hypothetical protein